MKYKKNKRMNQFIVKYWCAAGRHLAPANQNGPAVTVEAADKEWDEGKFPSEALVSACDHHLFTHALVRLKFCYQGPHWVTEDKITTTKDLGKIYEVCMDHKNYKTISDEKFANLPGVRG